MRKALTLLAAAITLALATPAAAHADLHGAGLVTSTACDHTGGHCVRVDIFVLHDDVKQLVQAYGHVTCINATGPMPCGPCFHGVVLLNRSGAHIRRDEFASDPPGQPCSNTWSTWYFFTKWQPDAAGLQAYTATADWAVDTCCGTTRQVVTSTVVWI